MDEGTPSIVFKDATLREGLDVPGVALDRVQRAQVAAHLAGLGVSEVEFVAPGRFWSDAETLDSLDLRGRGFRTTGLLWAAGEDFSRQVREAARILDRFDLLMPLSPGRPPSSPEAKRKRIVDAARFALDTHPEVGVGFPHATQVELGFLQEVCGHAAREGVKRITLYDTNGSADPFEVLELVRKVRDVAPVPLAFHPHNDLGMATANALAAVRGGAACLDVTVNGLGDRAGNASLEQVAVALALRGVDTGIRLDRLKGVCSAVAAVTGIPIPPLAPVSGAFAFVHKSPNHLGISQLFEAFDPAMVCTTRREVSD